MMQRYFECALKGDKVSVRCNCVAGSSGSYYEPDDPTEVEITNVYLDDKDVTAAVLDSEIEELAEQCAIQFDERGYDGDD